MCIWTGPTRDGWLEDLCAGLGSGSEWSERLCLLSSTLVLLCVYSSTWLTYAPYSVSRWPETCQVSAVLASDWGMFTNIKPILFFHVIADYLHIEVIKLIGLCYTTLHLLFKKQIFAWTSFLHFIFPKFFSWTTFTYWEKNTQVVIERWAMEMFNKAMRASDRRTSIHPEIQTRWSPSSIFSREELFSRVSALYLGLRGRARDDSRWAACIAYSTSGQGCSRNSAGGTVQKE